MKSWVDLKQRLTVRRHGAQLQPVHVDEAAIREAPLLLVCCARDERVRFPAFLAHYRRLGARHFLVVDNGSSDGLAEWLKGEGDCSVWHAAGSYRDAGFGMDWCNHLLEQWGVDKWCLTVDPDEFLIYPHCEYRGLLNLTRYMAARGQAALFAPLLDAYSDRSLSQTRLEADTDPFKLCPYFDRLNLTQRPDPTNRSVWVQGGVRMRRFFADCPEQAPALNKVPLVRWRRGLRYLSSTHHLSEPALNCPQRDRPEAVSGVLFHFKYVNLLQGKAAEEMQRSQHYAGSTEYRAYLDAGDVTLYDPQIAVRYAHSRQLQQLGFMQAGTWY